MPSLFTHFYSVEKVAFERDEKYLYKDGLAIPFLNFIINI
jgi:hypothetical protein